jgi:hypothetical protein
MMIIFTIYLVKFHEHQNCDEVHESGIKLKCDIGGADMVGARHHALKTQDKQAAFGCTDRQTGQTGSNGEIKRNTYLHTESKPH